MTMTKNECVAKMLRKGYKCEIIRNVVIFYEADEKTIKKALAEIGYESSWGIGAMGENKSIELPTADEEIPEDFEESFEEEAAEDDSQETVLEEREEKQQEKSTSLADEIMDDSPLDEEDSIDIEEIDFSNMEMHQQSIFDLWDE
ncbi:MAG: hypothetical protein K6E48_02595 [Lachnospiraceae bacterium]|nr:hypothetical protein [Lachnospiraceae bacterium]